MIVYKDILAKLKAAGYSTKRIRNEMLISEATLQSIRVGRPITTKTLDTICRLTGCRVEDLVEYREEPSV